MRRAPLDARTAAASAYVVHLCRWPVQGGSRTQILQTVCGSTGVGCEEVGWRGQALASTEHIQGTGTGAITGA